MDGGIQDEDVAPQAFVNIVIFDKDHNFLDAVWDQVHVDAEQDGATPDVPHDEMVKEYTITEEGHVYLYISNNSPVNVYFDDVTITHTPTNVIQYNEYYPFGLQASTIWTRENHKNDYLYNEGNELNQTSGWYETFFRGYDPAMGRFLQVDPMATMYAFYSGYNYALNDPVLLNDPTGAVAEPVQFCDWCLLGLSVPSNGGPGSGSHWSDSYRSVGGNAAMMSSSTFNSYYGIQSDQDRWNLAQQVTRERWNSLGGEEISREQWLKLGGDPKIFADKYYPGAWEAQQGYDQLLKSFREKYFGSTIADIESMYNVDSKSNWQIEWKIAVMKGLEGATDYDYSKGKIYININPAAFKDPRYLALTVGHELVHARDIANGNHLDWLMQFGPDESPWSPMWVIMETHAWQWTLQAENNPRLNMQLGPGAQNMLNQLVPMLPTDFAGFNHCKR